MCLLIQAPCQTAIWYMDNNRIISRDYGPTLDPGWDLQAVADFDSDGLDDYYLLFTSAYPGTGCDEDLVYSWAAGRHRVADGPPVT